MAVEEIVGFWPEKRRKDSQLSHMMEMGMEMRMRMVTVRWRVCDMRGHCWAPKAWEEMASMPEARPERTE